MNLTKLLRDSNENLRFLRRSIQQHLNSLPEGTLSVYHRKTAGKDYPFFLQIRPDGKRVYVKKQDALLKQLALKLFLEKELQYLDELLYAINSAGEVSERLNISSIMEELPEEIGALISFDSGENSVNTAKKIRQDRLSEWKNTPYTPNPYYSGERRHRTSDNTFVKSKSELIIYEKLLQYKIVFKYEAPLKIGDTIYYPDFTIMLPDGRIIYWEHAGMMNEEEYHARHKKKMEVYDSVGIVPWKNLIVTYDDENGNLDIRIVESEIRNKLVQ